MGVAKGGQFGGSHQMEIPQEPGHWAPEGWEFLNRSLSLSGTLKRGRVSLGGRGMTGGLGRQQTLQPEKKLIEHF